MGIYWHPALSGLVAHARAQNAGKKAGFLSFANRPCADTDGSAYRLNLLLCSVSTMAWSQHNYRCCCKVSRSVQLLLYWVSESPVPTDITLLQFQSNFITVTVIVDRFVLTSQAAVLIRQVQFDFTKTAAGQV